MIALAEHDNVAALEHAPPRLISTMERLALPMALGVALLIRLALLLLAPGVLDGDEALVGIQAERIADGTAHPLPVFFYGQPYMGSLEAYLAAALFRLWGPSVSLLRVVPLLFALSLVALTYSLTRRIVGRRPAAIAALLAALSPLYSTVWSLKVRGGYIETVALGSALLLVTHRLLYGPLDERVGARLPPRRRPWHYLLWSLWGGLAGLALWVNPLSLDYLLPCATALLIATLRAHRWRPGRHALRMAALPVLLMLGGALVGGLPLWADNLSSGGATLHYLLSGSASGGSLFVRAPKVAAFFASAVLPKLIGAWEPWGTAPPAALGGAAAVLYALAGGYVLVRLVAGRRGLLGYRGRPQQGQGLLLWFALVTSLLFCLSGFGANALNPFGFDAASRYGLPLISVLPVAAGAFTWRLWRLWRPLGATTLVLLLASTLYSYPGAVLRPNALFQSEYWSKLPLSQAPLAAFLRGHDIRDVWMNHWAGNALIFETDGAVAAADYNDVVLHQGVDRLPWAMERVAHDRRAAYVLVTAEPDPPLAQLLRARQIRYSVARVGPYLIFWQFSRPVPPASVAAGIGFSY